ncbi:hypothetical protein MCAP1_001436 [Malassezia caprae]|uniref:F-box domain-containing protein n=1 Tax=Malassezia caprae TaxID=1381934 RepID=A0AAF0E5D3_9BASI|nr:hypothetical protein MCAP1_001436 [Malassezia caprae]
MRLPEELQQQVLASLGMADLARMARVSKQWHHVARSDAVWRATALRQGYIHVDCDITTALELCRTDPRHAMASRYLDGTSTYYELCRRLCLLDRHWGRSTAMAEPRTDGVRELSPAARYLRPAGSDEDVWRIKLDHADHCIIVTGRRGGVRTIDVDTGELLWSIPPSETRRCPHLEWSHGYMIFDRESRGHFEVWRSERIIPEVAEPRRGAYRQYAILDAPHPILAYRFQYPTLLSATADDYVLLYDVPSRTLTQKISLASTATRGVNMYVDALTQPLHFDDNFVFLVGGSTFSITVLSRATQSAVWHLRDHLERFGEPSCYVPEPLPTTSALCFQQQHVYPVPPPHMLVASPDDVRRADSAGPSTWSAVHPDVESDTLVLLSQEGLLLFRHYSAHLLHGAAPELIYVQLPNRVYARPEDRPEEPLDEVLPPNWGLMLEHFMPGQLAVAHGRVFMVHGMLLMMDLLAPSGLSARYSDRPGTVPFSVYRWSDVMVLEHRRIHGFPYWNCSCVQMDRTGVYCVSTQVLHKEIDTDLASFSPGYEIECHLKNSTMAMAFRFDLGAEPACRPVDMKSYDDALRAADEEEARIHALAPSTDSDDDLDIQLEPWTDMDESDGSVDL